MDGYLKRWGKLVADFVTPDVRDRLPVTALIVFQAAIFWVSLHWMEISFACSVPVSGQAIWGWISFIHLFFLPLFVLGFLSAYLRHLRVLYVALLLLGLAVLPLQVWLLNLGYLRCDYL